jgi:pimeloyl-ACP methyl ester carboxylesterase
LKTNFANSPDGTRVAYDLSGVGPAIILLHGGGSKRQEWHEAGYVRRLRDKFTVITMDLRGHGESGLPTDPEYYTPEKMGQDVLAVADVCEYEQFILCGMSYGGNVSRYLAVRSGRVSKLILMGTKLGLGVTGDLRQQAIDFCEHWPPIIQALKEGSLDPASLSKEDQDLMNRFSVPVMLAWVRAMLDWPAIVPADFSCPTLWMVGSEDRGAIASVMEYKHALDGSMIQAYIVQGLDHEGVFFEVDKVFPKMLAFSESQVHVK